MHIMTMNDMHQLSYTYATVHPLEGGPATPLMVIFNGGQRNPTREPKAAPGLMRSSDGYLNSA